MPAFLNSKAPAISSSRKARKDEAKTLKLMTLEDRQSWLDFLHGVASESYRAYLDASNNFQNLGRMLPSTPAKGRPSFIEHVLHMAANSRDHTGGDYIPYLTVIYDALVDLLKTPLEGNAHLPLEFNDDIEDSDENAISMTIINEKGRISWRSNYAPTDLLGLADPYAVKTESIMQHLLQRLFTIIHFRLTERISRGAAPRTRKDLVNEAKKDYPEFIKVFGDAIACVEGHADDETED
ncbi:unnamed protein product [Cyclocybe aegerita]|uniref:Uncharacterized protein n=1 Tax=Cyclocybe aegerita TaxID=1973307 RepID=A0A8S0WZS3_CYCAE|nr:unnamed protein product [Cyclocybe aegerita]